MSELIKEVVNKVLEYLSESYSYQTINDICVALGAIVGEECENIFQARICQDVSIERYNQLQTELATINEKEDVRKSKGVFYTPLDVVQFITLNCIRSIYGLTTPDSLGLKNLTDIPAEDFCLTKSILEPTCGAGEFLLSALMYKLKLWNSTGRELSADTLRVILSSLHGNDINAESTLITKIRLFLAVLTECGVDLACETVSAINNSFTTYDFVELPNEFDEKFDIILGNPPYVEDSKYGELADKYGNIYCNVLFNSSKHLTDRGVIGFIIPLSYISTPRMKKIRDRLYSVLPTQYILSYADRPDCLFAGVHQKLCILLACPGNQKTTYTSNYLYWYKEERDSIFAAPTVILNPYTTDAFIPKLGRDIDISIYQKIMDAENRESVYAVSRVGNESVYLNRRETFWIKAYREPHIHPEFKVFSYINPGEADYCYCLVNSSLFWWYWICVSDCWHVSKELNGFKAPRIEEFEIPSKLADQLIRKLEETKVFVGTKQTDYEYKHNACIKEIHEIDDFINNLFGLTEEESSYIKNFAFRYRMSGGAVCDECN